MGQEDIVKEFRMEAFSLLSTDPRKAIELLMAAARRYEHSLTVANLVLNDIIEIAGRRGFWDEAIWACQKAQELKPIHREAYAVQEKVCRLNKAGEHIEAIEVRMACARKRGDQMALRSCGDKLAQMGEHDRAWRAYNEAASMAMEQGYHLPSVRMSMAELLIKEGKPDAAVEILITGIYEAQKMSGRVPRMVEKDLRKALNAAGINLRLKRFRGFADEVIVACKTRGQQYAIELFHERRKKEAS